jgi:hypothetical protein
MALGAEPKGVSMESIATDPTTSTLKGFLAEMNKPSKGTQTRFD